MLKYILIAPLLALLAGCEVDNTSSSSEPLPELATTPPATGDAGDAANNLVSDDPEWDSIVWYTGRGPSGAGATKVMSLSAEIISGDQVRFSWDQYPFGNKWAVGHFFVLEDGVYKGGKFEWIRNPGQGIKLLGNIRAGYNGLRAPAPGTPVAFAWTSEDGKRRSNLAKTTWR